MGFPVAAAARLTRRPDHRARQPRACSVAHAPELAYDATARLQCHAVPGGQSWAPFPPTRALPTSIVRVLTTVYARVALGNCARSRIEGRPRERGAAEGFRVSCAAGLAVAPGNWYRHRYRYLADGRAPAGLWHMLAVEPTWRLHADHVGSPHLELGWGVQLESSSEELTRSARWSSRARSRGGLSRGELT